MSRAGAALEASLENHDPDAFQAAVERQLNARMTALADGILRYRRHPYRRDLAEPPVLWRDGTTRLLDYGTSAAHGAGPAPPAQDAPPVLVVPSLINRGYILDLSAERSFLRWLAGQGLRPFLVDWDRPGSEERDFTLTDYIAGRLEGALDAVLAETGQQPAVIGYCMGGLLALALALRRPDDVSGLALLATPWDFHADTSGQGALAAAALPGLAPLMEAYGELPVDIIQGLFAGLDPQLVLRKFLAFARLDPDSPRAAAFVALEDWLNDGVALSAPVARECLGGWYGENTPARGTWRVAGEVVDPRRLALPSLCLIPAQDRIVPPASARALAGALAESPAGTETLGPRLGHIGMMVSAGAEDQVWRPLAGWLTARAGDTEGGEVGE